MLKIDSTCRKNIRRDSQWLHPVRLGIAATRLRPCTDSRLYFLPDPGAHLYHPLEPAVWATPPTPADGCLRLDFGTGRCGCRHRLLPGLPTASPTNAYSNEIKNFKTYFLITLMNKIINLRTIKKGSLK